MRKIEDVNVKESVDLCSFCFPSREILYEDDNIYVMVSKGSFIEGYLLLINKKHKNCFASVMGDNRWKVKKKIKDIMREEYGSCCLFEHGKVGSCLKQGNDKICFHAHLHCLPIEDNFLPMIEKEIQGVKVSDLNDLKSLYEKHRNYLYLEMNDGEKKFFPIEENNLESQYLRKKSCEVLDIPVKFANWRKYPFLDKMGSTEDKLRHSFNKI